jgi:curli biogenesis system outer membrane secretion channel CsgG
MRTIGIAAALSLVAASAACGYSATAGTSRLPPGSERVHVPSFANRTADAATSDSAAAIPMVLMSRRS